MGNAATASNVEYIGDVPEVVGLFHDNLSLQSAIFELKMAGFGQHEVSVIGLRDSFAKMSGVRFRTVAEIDYDPEGSKKSLASCEKLDAVEPYLTRGFFFYGSDMGQFLCLDSTSALASSVPALAIRRRPACVVGALLAQREGVEYRDQYAQSIGKGGFLVWVRGRTSARQVMARRILQPWSSDVVTTHKWLNV